jgi:uncharacterized membrane protein
MGNEDPRRQPPPPTAAWPANAPPSVPPASNQPYPPGVNPAPNYPPPYSAAGYPPQAAPNVPPLNNASPNYAAPPYGVPPEQYSSNNAPSAYQSQPSPYGTPGGNYAPGYQYPPQTPPHEAGQYPNQPQPYQPPPDDANELLPVHLEPNVAAAISYLFWVVSGAYFLFTEKENQFVRFHAMQSIVFGAAWIIFYFVSSLFLITVSTILSLIGVPTVWKLFGLIVNMIYLGWFGVWVMLMYKAYNKEAFSLPVLGDIVSKQLKHWNKQL